MSNSTLRRMPWRKVMYESQSYPDNYVDMAFLENVNVREYRSKINFVDLFLLAAVVVFQISVCVWYFTIYKGIESTNHMQNRLSFTNLLVLNGTLLSGILCTHVIIESLGLYSISNRSSNLTLWNGIIKVIGTVTLFLLYIRLTAPVLRALTITYSTDTVYALCLVLISIHIIFYDYDYIMHAAASSQPSTLTAERDEATVGLLPRDIPHGSTSDGMEFTRD